jgi:hypothetical protein
MPGLLDVAALQRTVDVNGTPVAVPGISVHGVAALLDRFPDLRRIVTGQSVNITPEWLITNVPDAIAAVIAAGTGYPGDEQAESVASSLALENQTELLETILEVTLPNGVSPFMERLRKLAQRLGVEATSIADGN